MKTFMGFTGVNDFLNSLFGAKYADFNLMGAFIAALTSIITSYMWDDYNAVITLWLLMGADWLTGIIKSMKSKQFVSNKLYRMPLFFVTTSAVIAFSWWIAKTSVLFHLLPSIVMGGFLSVYFVSLLENLGELELLPRSMVKILKHRFGLKALMEKFEHNEDKTTEEIKLHSKDE